MATKAELEIQLAEANVVGQDPEMKAAALAHKAVAPLAERLKSYYSVGAQVEAREAIARALIYAASRRDIVLVREEY